MPFLFLFYIYIYKYIYKKLYHYPVVCLDGPAKRKEVVMEQITSGSAAGRNHLGCDKDRLKCVSTPGGPIFNNKKNPKNWSNIFDAKVMT